ncbi:angiopoietin-related protein 7-like [Drosophila montana]|uniref:angiopoietin-related protein 7-like n=1 Tax=Drosophila montana TaxID=40370 RepID=UPI00313AFF03
MKFVTFIYILFISLILIIAEAEFNENESCVATRIAEEECGKYTHKAVRPLLKYIHQMKEAIENHNNRIEGKDKEIKQLQEKLNQHNQFIIEALKELTKNVLSIKEEMGKLNSNALKIQDYEEQLGKQKQLIDQKDQQISEIKNEVNICSKKLKSECTDFADAPGIHVINPDQEDPFNVQCDSATAGPGWTVIQQRINGKEDFYRDWAAYRAGFGSFEGDFFLGLERIHRLTSAQPHEPHELYIHMEGFDGIIKYYRYEEFAIAGEDDQYRLNISDKAVGNATGEELYYHNKQKFSTFDRDNDNWDDENCTNKNNCGGGWWYKSCGGSTSLQGLKYVWDNDLPGWVQLYFAKLFDIVVCLAVNLAVNVFNKWHWYQFSQHTDTAYTLPSDSRVKYD